MPSWNEKPHVTPTINVNILATHAHSSDRDHDADCAPVLVPLSLEPFRSVTLTVRLGECRCFEPGNEPLHGGHWSDCKGGPIRVTVFIDGEDWPDSEVGEIDVHESSNPLAVDTERLLAACRDRWALVKALVLGHTDLSALLTGPRAVELLTQRDAVFSALAVQARLEVETLAAQQATVAAIASPRLTASGTSPEDRPSAQALAVYVERLIEQVGVLP